MDKFYQLLDRDPSTISPVWKGTHLLCFTLAIVSGFIAAYSLGKTEEYFGHNCILFASISFQVDSTNASAKDQAALLELPEDTVRPFNMSHTQWGSVKLCNFCQFTPLCSTISAILWGTMFIICSRGGAGYMTDEIYRPWRLIYPAMIYILISTAAMLASLLQLSSGIKHFCAQFEPIFNTTSCIQDIDLYTMSFYPTKKPLITVLKLGLAFTYICFFAGLIHLCLIVLRILCIVDFQMIRITVTSARLDNTLLNGVDLEGNSSSTSGNELERNLSVQGIEFASPIDEEKDSSTVPIAQSESLSDVLSSSPHAEKEKRSVRVRVSSTDIDIDNELYDAYLTKTLSKHTDSKKKDKFK